MEFGSVAFLERVTESSPVIVLILLGGYVLGGRLMIALLARLDRKDEQITKMSNEMNKEMLTAIHAMTEALERLSEAINHADRRR